MQEQWSNKISNIMSLSTSQRSHQQAAATAGSSSSDTTTMEVFEVLYYKRTKKKRIAKNDGFLQIFPPPSSIVTLIDESNGGSQQPIFRGVSREISKHLKDNGSISMDDVLVVGSYEVQILSNCVSSSSSSIGVGASAGANAGTYSSSASLLKSAKPPASLARRTSLVSSTKQRQQQQRPGLKGTVGFSRKSASVANDDDDDKSSCSHDNPEDGQPLPRTALHQKENLVGSKRRLSTTTFTTKKLLPAFKKPTRKISPTLPHSTTTTTAIPAAAASKPKMDSGTAGTLSTNFFPNAIGNLNVPHSIRSVLRPHQIEGVTFLWNCLTGNGRPTMPLAASASVSAVGTDTSIHKGAILADEMGLGKTLMTIGEFHVCVCVCVWNRASHYNACGPLRNLHTIFNSLQSIKSCFYVAAICALHRQKRDMVRGEKANKLKRCATVIRYKRAATNTN
jgi:hypothetical protein